MSHMFASAGWRNSAVAVALAFWVVLVGGACGTEQSATAPAPQADTAGGDGGGPVDGETQRFPDVIDVTVTPLDEGRYEVAVTMSSPYDTPERYADGWRVLDEEGNDLGRRELLHDHASEQPFTRQTVVEIPDGVERITVQGRDQISGYGGATVTVVVPRDR